jgi:lipopolysaccharide export LptBFGC system permease protein LptF
MANNYNNMLSQFNSLISSSQTALTCGPDCQKAQTAQTLQQNYINAKNNLQTAPNKVQDAAKKYYTQTKGATGYDTYMNNELEQKAGSIVGALKKTFSDAIANAKMLSGAYETQITNAQYASNLYDKYVDENSKLEKKLRNNSYDVFTNERKTYYEDQNKDSLNWWYKFFISLYCILLIAYAICFFISSSDYSIAFRILIFLFLCAYPFISAYIFNFFSQLWQRLSSALPKNAYLHV